MNSFFIQIHLIVMVLNYDEFFYHMNSFISVCYSDYHFTICFYYKGTNKQKKELFVMAIQTPTGRTFPGNFTIIPTAKK